MRTCQYHTTGDSHMQALAKGGLKLVVQHVHALVAARLIELEVTK